MSLEGERTSSSEVDARRDLNAASIFESADSWLIGNGEARVGVGVEVQRIETCTPHSQGLVACWGGRTKGRGGRGKTGTAHRGPSRLQTSHRDSS